VKIIAAPTHEQGQDFVVVLVKDRVIRDPNERETMLSASQREFGVRAALMGESARDLWANRYREMARRSLIRAAPVAGVLAQLVDERVLSQRPLTASGRPRHVYRPKRC
jgi:hypothetical protein